MAQTYMTTILVLDEFREGVAVCWIISNREDAAVIRQVLLKLKQRCGDIHTKKSLFVLGILTKVGKVEYVSIFCVKQNTMKLPSFMCTSK